MRSNYLPIVWGDGSFYWGPKWVFLVVYLVQLEKPRQV